MRFDELREKHPEFIYQGWETHKTKAGLLIRFNFLVEPDVTFHPEIVFPDTKEVDDALIFHLGLIEMISYWKAICSPKIVIKAGFLNEEQVQWWKDLLINGLGEFFYLNKIDFTSPDLVKIICAATFEVTARNSKVLKNRDLVLVGGGKDSAVTLEIINKSGREFNCLQLNPTQASVDIIRIAGVRNPIVIKRTLDPKLLELNAQGYLNGHTPFSAYLAFLGVMCAVLYGYKNVIVSNEASASEGNIEYLGKVVNHQYSKSFEFENLFRDYAKKYLSERVNYFSFLRPLNELQIARLFSGMEKYHQVFRSCNRGSKQNIWCGQCAKCLFAYIVLYPFLGEKTKQIFAKDLLNDENLLPLAEQLIRKDDVGKPFDCVGQAEESKEAFCLCLKKYQEEGQPLPLILEKLQNQLSCDYQKTELYLKNHWAKNNLDDEYSRLLRSQLSSRT